MKKAPSRPTLEKKPDRDDLPEGWASSLLGDIATVEWGNTSITKKSYVERGFPAFSASGRDGFLPTGEWQGPAVILSAIGARCGKCFYAEGKWTAIKNTIVIQADEHCINNRYLFLYLNDDKRWSISGSGQPFITMGTSQEVVVPVAPAGEQHRIVAKVKELLENVTASRDHLAKVRKILTAFRQSVLAAACSGCLTEEWREARHLGAWKPTTVKEVIVDRPRNGLSIKAVAYETSVRSLTLTATTSGRFDGRHFKYLDTEIPQGSHLWLRRGDILLQRGNTEEYVGVAAVYDGDKYAYIYPDLMIKIHPRQGVLSHFLWIALSNSETRHYFRDNSTGSQGSMPKINQTVVENAPLSLPSPQEQHEIVHRVEALFKLADKIEERVAAATKRADKLTQSILAKAFRGELVPTEAELARKENRSYEPASVLLERIKAERENVVTSLNGTRRRATRRKK